jgi:uncharacterized protein
MRKFSCVQDCSDCCINRQYYPSVEFGKIGVLILPEEKEAIENIAKKTGVKVRILPRLAVGKDAPDKIIAYQMMGKNDDGDLCPFLDASKRSPHGGFSCMIYSDRPLACRAYPVTDSGKAATLDSHCQFCKKFSTTQASTDSVHQEIEALAKIKASVVANDQRVWRYATATGDLEGMMPEGWVIEG